VTEVSGTGTWPLLSLFRYQNSGANRSANSIDHRSAIPWTGRSSTGQRR